jgi:hypothetical protein
MKPVALWLCAFLVLGLATGAVAQTASQSPSAQADMSSKPADAAGKTADASGTMRDTSRNNNVDASGNVRTDRAPSNPTPSERAGDIGANADKGAGIDRRDGGDSQASGSALPRSVAGGGHSTIFGLSPAAAVVIGSALLVVVILALVAMTRSGESTTYIDRDPRV